MPPTDFASRCIEGAEGFCGDQALLVRPRLTYVPTWTFLFSQSTFARRMTRFKRGASSRHRRRRFAMEDLRSMAEGATCQVIGTQASVSLDEHRVIVSCLVAGRFPVRSPSCLPTIILAFNTTGGTRDWGSVKHRPLLLWQPIAIVVLNLAILAVAIELVL
jgi:hypothetical protein